MSEQNEKSYGVRYPEASRCPSLRMRNGHKARVIWKVNHDVGVVRKEACKVNERVCWNNFGREGPGRENGPQRYQNRPLRQYKEKRRSAKIKKKIDYVAT